MRAAAVLCFCVLAVPCSLNAQVNTWTPTGSMTTPRNEFTLNLLPSGEVLAAGGYDSFFGDALSSAEIYDPAAGVWAAAGSMSGPRNGHTATTLSDGRVLVAGGCTSTGGYCPVALATAEIFDPATGTWLPTGSMSIGRSEHAAALLADGRVLVAGGFDVCTSTSCSPTPSAEIYDPATGTWSMTTPMPAPRQDYTLTTLPTGNVLLAGGCGPYEPLSCSTPLITYVFVPSTATWMPSGSMSVPRSSPAVVVLPSGDVLVSGGVSMGYVQTSAERYDPETDIFSSAGTMTAARWRHTATVLEDGSVLAAGDGRIADLYYPASNTWVRTGNLNVGRTNHRAVRLADGRVLVAGGEALSVSDATASAEVYTSAPSPLVVLSATGTDFGLQAIGTTSDDRIVTVTNAGSLDLTITQVSITGAQPGDFSATLLCGGTVAPGGSCDIRVNFSPTFIQNRSAILEIADNAPDSPQHVGLSGVGYGDAPNFWQPAGNMTAARTDHTLTLLADGRVLAAGGLFGLPAAELYDPAAGVWTATPNMNAARVNHTATLLADGRVLVVGGGSASAELYNPLTNTWTPTAAMSVARSDHTASLLPDGRVLVVGGCGLLCRSVERYDPATGSWSRVRGTSSARTGHAATTLANGRILVTGGGSQTAEAYLPLANIWVPAGLMVQPRIGHVAAALPGGRVLVSGGCGGSYCRSAEIFQPLTVTWSATNPMNIARVRHAGAALPDGRVLVSGGNYFCDPEFGFCFTTRAADVFDPATGTWTRVFPMIVPRESFPAAVLQDGRVLVSGGYSDQSPIQSSAETFRPE